MQVKLLTEKIDFITKEAKTVQTNNIQSKTITKNINRQISTKIHQISWETQKVQSLY